MSSLLPPVGPFLYKYGSVTGERLDWLRSILLKHEVYFPSPRELKDPKDARPKLTVSSKEEALRRIVNPYLTVHAADPLDELAWHVRNLMTMVDARDPDQIAEWITPLFHRGMEKHRIYSMTTRPDNAHLWTHYADRHTGYCLEFLTSGPPFDHALEVVYGDETEIDFCSPDTIDATFLFGKTRPYAPEEEVRILLFPRGQPHEVSFEPTLLRRVILGRHMVSQHRHMIREWCRLRAPELQVVEESREIAVVAVA